MLSLLNSSKATFKVMFRGTVYSQFINTALVPGPKCQITLLLSLATCSPSPSSFPPLRDSQGFGNVAR